MMPKGNVFLVILVGTVLGMLLLVGFVAIFYIGIFHSPIDIPREGFGYVTWQYAATKNICDYTLPSEFRFRQYMEGDSARRWGLQVFTRDQQQLIFLRVPYHLHVDATKVVMTPVELGGTYFQSSNAVKNYNERIQGLRMTLRDNKTGQVLEEKDYPVPPKHPVDEHFFDVSYYIPFLYRKYPAPDDHTLLLRGFQKTGEAVLEAPTTRIKVWYGDFQKLALDKARRYWIRKPVTVVLHFPKRKTGGIALIQNKATGETFFALTTVPVGQTFSKEEFEAFLKTVTFDAQIYDPDAELRKIWGDRYKVKEIHE